MKHSTDSDDTPVSQKTWLIWLAPRAG